MTGFRIAGFSGLVPRMARQLLAPNQAQVATNCNLTSGDLRSRNGPRLVFKPVVDGDIQSMFRMEKDGQEKWLAWNRDVDVARSPIADNVDRRFYYTGDGEPRVSNFDVSTQGSGPYPSGCYVLGVSPPIVKPTVSASGGASATTVTRVYAYTFVTPWDEESAPSPPSTPTSGKIDATWSLSGLAVPPVNSGTISGALRNMPTAGYVTITMDTVYGLREHEEIRFAGIVGMTDLNGAFPIHSVDTTAKTITVNLFTAQIYTSGGTWERTAPHNTGGMTKRVYRLATSESGDEYHYVVTLSDSVTTFSDTVTDANLGGVMPSTKWLMPPADLRGIVILPNGIAAGFTNNNIHFSEPFKPYAWPEGYIQAYDQDIVAIGVTGTTLVGLTEGNPFTITGVEPLTMGGGMEKLAVAWPCMAKRSVASFAFGVAYAAPQGLVIIGAQNDVVTKDLFTQKEWSDLTPTNFIAATADNRYYAGYSANQSSMMFVIDKTEAASFVTINQKISAIWTDPATGKLYVAIDGDIYEWEGDAGVRIPYEWKSKLFLLPSPVNYGAAKIDVDFGIFGTGSTVTSQESLDAIIAGNEAIITAGETNDAMAEPMIAEYEIGGDAMQPLPGLSADTLQFQLWAGGTLKHSQKITSSRAFRLPSGYKTDNVEVILAGNVRVSGVVLAETMDGLKQL